VHNDHRRESIRAGPWKPQLPDDRYWWAACGAREELLISKRGRLNNVKLSLGRFSTERAAVQQHEAHKPN
jgi:hypothetical protein